MSRDDNWVKMRFMKTAFTRHLVVIMLMMAACLPAWAAEDCSCNPLEQAFKAQILQVESERYAAMVKPDYEVLEKVIADNAIYSHSTGNVQSKQQFIDSLKTGQMRYRSITPTVPLIRFYGDLAIVNGVGSFDVTLNKVELSSRLVYTAIYNLKTDTAGRYWQLVSWHSSAVPAK